MQDRILWLLTGVAGIVLLSTALWQQVDLADFAKETTPPTSVQRLEEPIRIEILNGCGVSQVAAHLTRKTRRLGFDVIHEGNAAQFGFLHSVVIDRSGDWDNARKVAAILGIPHCVQQIAADGAPLADVSVVIGSDYQRLGLLKE